MEKVQALLGLPVNKSAGVTVDDLKKILQIFDVDNPGEEKKVVVHVAYTLLACSTFLAPRQANPTIPDELFEVVLDHENLGRYDWAGYVLSHLEYAIRKLRASLTGRNEVFVLGACPVAAEVLCFFCFLPLLHFLDGSDTFASGDILFTKDKLLFFVFLAAVLP
jgi:hypothetical protein